MNNPESSPGLKREVGPAGAVVIGLGSMLGAGVFVSVGFAADLAGPATVLAVLLAAALAACNGLSSAQLAAAHPVSGGSYEYGYRFLNPWWGFAAGWLFLAAKSASAATAALGFALYAFPAADPILPGAAAVLLLTLLTLTGLRRTNRVNAVLVAAVLAGLLAFAAVGLFKGLSQPDAHNFSLTPFFGHLEGQPGGGRRLARFLEAAALMFVAYTGYGRVATLGEEIRNPQKSIPLAVISVMIVTMLLYALVALAVAGYDGSASSDAEAGLLAGIAQRFGSPWLSPFLIAAAAVALLGVLLNLILGLSRVWLAMGRKRDMPAPLARISPNGNSPRVAVAVAGAVIAALVFIGDVKAAWSFSAFTVLGYYAVANLAALKLPPELRLYPRAVSYGGLAGCAFLAFWVEPTYWLVGLAVLAAGMLWKTAFNRLSTAPETE